jgi:hypothetical protein
VGGVILEFYFGRRKKSAARRSAISGEIPRPSIEDVESGARDGFMMGNGTRFLALIL